jgi:hypothetical protein
MARIIHMRSAAQVDIQALIDQVSECTSDFAILKSKTHISLYCMTLLSRSNFQAEWRSKTLSNTFSRGSFLPSFSTLQSVSDTEDKLLYSKISSLSTPPVKAPNSIEMTPPKKKKRENLDKCPLIYEGSAESHLSQSLQPLAQSLQPVSQSLPAVPLPSLTPVPKMVSAPPPYYIKDYVTFAGNTWTTNFSSFFAEVALPEEKAYCEYLLWVELVAPKLKCILIHALEDFDDLHEMYYKVCDHIECHAPVPVNCPGCEQISCCCMKLVIDNSWIAQRNRAKIEQNWAEMVRCENNYIRMVPDPPGVFMKDRVRLRKLANYNTLIAAYTDQQKMDMCSFVCERLLRAPGSSDCNSLEQLRKNAQKA